MTDKELEPFTLMVHDIANLIIKKKIKNIMMPYVNGYDYNSSDNDLPNINPIYKESIALKNEIEVHSKKGVFPYKILKTKAPNQSPDEWEYQKGLYESYTNSVWNRAKNKTKIISNDQNFSIDNWDAEQKKYFYEDYPIYHSIQSYFFDIVRDKKIDYPNQVLLVKPKNIPGAYNDQGEFIPSQNEMVEPICVLIEEEHIMRYNDGEYLLVLISCNIEYLEVKTKKYDGLQFELYDKNSIIRYTQNGLDKSKNPTFEIITIYEHNLGRLPAWKLQGKPISNLDGNVLYHSPYIDAVPDLNAVIRLCSNLDMSTYRLAFPIIIALVDHCRHKNEHGQSCTGGNIFNGSAWEQCGACEGSGKRNNHSPTGVYEIAASKGLDGDNTLAMSPPVQFAAPPSDILKYISEQIEVKKKNSFSFMFETDQANNQTATGKQLEKEEFHSFLIDFSNQLFNLMDLAIQAIGWYRFGDKFKKPSIRKPTSFSFRTNEDITTEIGEAIKNNLPMSYRRLLLLEANNTRFNNNPQAQQELEFIMMIDRLYGMDDLTIRAGLGQTLGKLDVIIHNSIATFIDNCIRDNPEFWNISTTFEARKEAVIKLAQAEYDILNPVGGGGGNALAESVGGLTGMVEIVGAVARGEYDLDAAIKLVSSRFGVTEDEARQQLGTPQLSLIPPTNKF